MRSGTKWGSGLSLLACVSSLGGCALVYGYDNYEGTGGATGGAGGATGGSGGTGTTSTVTTGGSPAGGSGGSVTGGGGHGGGPAGGSGGAGGGSVFETAAWSLPISGDKLQAVNGLDISGGELLFTGASLGDFELLGQSYQTASPRLFVARVHADGTAAWKWSDVPAGFETCGLIGNAISRDTEQPNTTGAFVAGSCVSAQVGGFVARIGPSGPLWMTPTSSMDGDTQAGGVAIGADGLPHFMASAAGGNVTFNGTSYPAGSGEQIALLSCQNLDCSGAPNVAFEGGANTEVGKAFTAATAADGGLALYMAGHYRGGWSDEPVLPDPAVQGPQTGSFVSMYRDANKHWAMGFVPAAAVSISCDSTLGDSAAAAIAVDPDDLGGDGSVVVTGHTCYQTLFGMSSGNPEKPPHGGKLDAFVAKLNAADGALIWAKVFGDSEDQMGTGVAVDPNTHHVFFTGTFAGELSLSPQMTLSVTEPGMQKVFVAELDENGGLVDARAFEGPEPIAVRVVRIAVDNASIYLGGLWSAQLDFGNGKILSGTSIDGFVARFARQ